MTPWHSHLALSINPLVRGLPWTATRHDSHGTSAAIFPGQAAAALCWEPCILCCMRSHSLPCPNGLSGQADSTHHCLLLHVLAATRNCCLSSLHPSAWHAAQCWVPGQQVSPTASLRGCQPARQDLITVLLSPDCCSAGPNATANAVSSALANCISNPATASATVNVIARGCCCCGETPALLHVSALFLSRALITFAARRNCWHLYPQPTCLPAGVTMLHAGNSHCKLQLLAPLPQARSPACRGHQPGQRLSLCLRLSQRLSHRCHRRSGPGLRQRSSQRHRVHHLHVVHQGAQRGGCRKPLCPSAPSQSSPQPSWQPRASSRWEISIAVPPL